MIRDDEEQLKLKGEVSFVLWEPRLLNVVPKLAEL